MKIFSPGIHVKTASLSQELLYQLCGGGHAVFAQQAGLVCPTSACVRQIGVKTRWRHRRNLDDEVRCAVQLLQISSRITPIVHSDSS